MSWLTRRRPARVLTDSERELLTTGLAGFCKHGIGMLDNCEECCPRELPSEPDEHAALVGQLNKLAQELEAERTRNRALRAALAEGREHRCPTAGEAVEWKRRAEQDRRNAVALEDRLARAEGRPPASKLPGGSW